MVLSKILEKALTEAMVIINNYQAQKLTEIQHLFTSILKQLTKLGLLYLIQKEPPSLEQIMPPCAIIRDNLKSLLAIEI